MIRRYSSVSSLRRSAVDSLKIGVNHARTQTVLQETDRQVVSPGRQEANQPGAGRAGRQAKVSRPHGRASTRYERERVGCVDRKSIAGVRLGGVL